MDDLSRLVIQVAECLGKDWRRSRRFDEDGQQTRWREELEGPNQESLFFSTTWAAKGRLYISGTYPVGVQMPYGERILSITVNQERPAKDVAREVETRLLPKYREQFQKVMKGHLQEVEYKKRKEEQVKKAAQVTKGRVSQNGGPDHVFTKGPSLYVSSEDHIEIQCMYVTFNQLERIVAAVPELFGL